MKKKTRNFVNNVELNVLILGYEISNGIHKTDMSCNSCMAHNEKTLLSYDYEVHFEYEIQSLEIQHPTFFYTTQGFSIYLESRISTGAGAIREQLADLDLRIIIENSLVEWKTIRREGPTRGMNGKIEKLTGMDDFMSLTGSLPPELRPIIQIEGVYLSEQYSLLTIKQQVDLHQGELVMFRKNWYKKPWIHFLIMEIRGQPMRDGHNKVYKDVIEGKEEDFRETLLGKRVDYSGRSVR
ncbi:hypothetical protein HID58_094731 [Brassica napus]|uniref:Uncharacterized protein n=1 Tax=Brassica napus TaxID=3708 RepID=A0ABQ7X683_BRANA|nr:hypothetical protein HID58_094731 [Brassica napus]